MVQWLCVCRNGAVAGIAARLPVDRLERSLAATCFCLREWRGRAVWSDGSAGGRPINRPERWSWRRMAAVLAQSAARLSMDRLERSLLVT